MRNPVYHFCTYFDRHYLARGLTLYRSLSDHAGDFVLWVLCFDDDTYDALSRLNQPNLRPVSLHELEQGDERLLVAKGNRSRIEYYFTCTPSWPLYIMNHAPDVDLVTYVDADILFYASPAPIYDELGDDSILIIEHRFPERRRHLATHGRFNVGYLTFRNDTYGRECLEWWRERCLDWCYDRIEDGRFADQGYLSDWPERFRGVVVLQHKGANVAPWNWSNYRIHIDHGRPTVDGEPLIFYHFHGFKIINRRLCEPGLLGYDRMPLALRRWLYTSYLRALRDTEDWTRRTVPEIKSNYADARMGSYGRWRFTKRLLQGQLMLSSVLVEQAHG